MSLLHELDGLLRRVERIEKQLGIEPPKPYVPGPFEKFDPTDHMSMPQSAMDDLVKAVPTRVVKDTVGDLRNPGRLK